MRFSLEQQDKLLRVLKPWTIFLVIVFLVLVAAKETRAADAITNYSLTEGNTTNVVVSDFENQLIVVTTNRYWDDQATQEAGSWGAEWNGEASSETIKKCGSHDYGSGARWWCNSIWTIVPTSNGTHDVELTGTPLGTPGVYGGNGAIKVSVVTNADAAALDTDSGAGTNPSFGFTAEAGSFVVGTGQPGSQSCSSPCVTAENWTSYILSAAADTGTLSWTNAQTSEWVAAAFPELGGDISIDLDNGTFSGEIDAEVSCGDLAGPTYTVVRCVAQGDYEEVNFSELFLCPADPTVYTVPGNVPLRFYDCSLVEVNPITYAPVQTFVTASWFLGALPYPNSATGTPNSSGGSSVILNSASTTPSRDCIYDPATVDPNNPCPPGSPKTFWAFTETIFTTSPWDWMKLIPGAMSAYIVQRPPFLWYDQMRSTFDSATTTMPSLTLDLPFQERTWVIIGSGTDTGILASLNAHDVLPGMSWQRLLLIILDLAIAAAIILLVVAVARL